MVSSVVVVVAVKMTEQGKRVSRYEVAFLAPVPG